MSALRHGFHQVSLHHRGRDAESFGNLRLLQPCEAVEQKDIPPARRHFSDGLIQCASELIPLEQIIGQRSGGWGFLQFAEIDQETIADVIWRATLIPTRMAAT